MTEEELQELRRDVRYLKDRAEIRDCLLRYARGVDRLDWDLAATAYHPDAIDDRGAITGTRDEYLKWLHPIIESASGTSHSITNMTYDIDGDTAHTECYVITAVWSEDKHEVMMGGARYISRLERRNGEWKLIRQEAPMDFTYLVPTQILPPGALRSLRSHDDRSYQRPLDLTAEARQRYETKSGQ